MTGKKLSSSRGISNSENILPWLNKCNAFKGNSSYLKTKILGNFSFTRAKKMARKTLSSSRGTRNSEKSLSSFNK